jgi:UrcA family protein
LSLALAIGALAVLGARAHAEDLDQITISPPAMKVIGHDPATEAPIEETTVEAQIALDEETLTTDSGVMLVNDRVMEAAYEACNAADPLTQDDGTCVREALKSAQDQVNAAIAQARGDSASR